MQNKLTILLNEKKTKKGGGPKFSVAFLSLILTLTSSSKGEGMECNLSAEVPGVRFLLRKFTLP
jgi:hypothetical protein